MPTERRSLSATRLFDAERVNLEKGIAHLEAQLNAPVEANASHYLASEVRAFVRAMPHNERVFFVRAAIRRGEDVTASAVLGAPAFLSGIPDDMLPVLVLMYREHNAPEDAAKLKTMKGAKALIEERGGLIFRELEKAVGRQPHEVRHLREAKARSDKAFAL